MGTPNNQHRPVVPSAMTLPELMAIVFGFALSSALFRNGVQHVMQHPSIGGAIVLVLSFVWLGGAISGPCVIVTRRFVLRDQTRISDGERIWVFLGTIWVLVGIQQQFDQFGSMSGPALALAGATGEIASLVMLWLWLRQRRFKKAAAERKWAAHAGIACAATWPVAWVLVAVQLRT